MQEVHGLKHLFSDTSASKDETDDKDNVPTIANNAPIDFEPLVHSENRDDLAACATTLTRFNLEEFNRHMTEILAAQHLATPEVLFMMGDDPHLITPALQNITIDEKIYLHRLLGFDFKPSSTLHFVVDSETNAVDKDALVLKRENGFSLFMLRDYMTDLNQIVPAVFDVSLQDGQLKSIDEHHVFYTNTSTKELIVRNPMMVLNGGFDNDQDGRLFELARTNIRLDGEGDPDDLFGHPCLSKRFLAQIQRSIFQFKFPAHNRLLVLATDGNYYAVEHNSDGTFVKHPVSVDNSGIPPILKNQNMTADDARYFSDDIIESGRCAEGKVAFHQISRMQLPGDENGQYLPASSEGLTEVYHHYDATTRASGPIFYALNGESKQIMDNLGAAIFDNEYSSFKPVTFFKNITAVDASDAKNSEVGWIQTITDDEKKIHLYSNQALPMVHSFSRGRWHSDSISCYSKANSTRVCYCWRRWVAVIPNDGPSQRHQCVSSFITHCCFNWS